jgi:hypothetical protein
VDAALNDLVADAARLVNRLEELRDKSEEQRADKRPKNTLSANE